MPEQNRPSWTRGSLARGLKVAGGAPAVDRENRVIRGAALVTRGEALGHGFWIDREFLDQTVKAGRGTGPGIKARFTHPGMCSDGMGKYLGRWRNVSRDGDVARGDLHLAESASRSPDGDLAGYVMDLAEEDPAAFGASIVFGHDWEAEQAFLGEHTTFDEQEKRAVFRSPDEDNADNLRHARLSDLRAADVVDEPAANPAGLFSRGAELARRAEAFLDWALSGQGQPPEIEPAFGIEAERAREFLMSYLDRRGVRLSELTAPGGSGASAAQEVTMAEEKNQATPPAQKPPDVAALQAEARAAGRKEEREALEQMLGAFPKDRAFALESFAKGLSVDQAKAARAETLAARVEQLEKENGDLKSKASPPPPPAGKAAEFAELPAGQRDFLGAVRALVDEKGLGLGEAMAQIAREQPELHRAYLGLGGK